MCVLFVFFVYTVTDFSAAEKDRGVKFCTSVRLLAGISFSHFGELWLAESHGGGISFGMYAVRNWMKAAAPSEARWDSELGAAALLKAVWWDLRLASLLTHLLFCLWSPYVIGRPYIFSSCFFLLSYGRPM